MKMLLYRQLLHTASRCLYTQHENATVQTISPHSQSTLVHTWKCYSTISPHSQSMLVHTWKCYSTDNFSTQPVHACTHNMEMLQYNFSTQLVHTCTHNMGMLQYRQFLHTASPHLYTQHGNTTVQTISPHSQSTLVHTTWKCCCTDISTLPSMKTVQPIQSQPPA